MWGQFLGKRKFFTHAISSGCPDALISDFDGSGFQVMFNKLGRVSELAWPHEAFKDDGRLAREPPADDLERSSPNSSPKPTPSRAPSKPQTA